MTTTTRPSVTELIQALPPLRPAAAASLACLREADSETLAQTVAQDPRLAAVAACAPETLFFPGHGDDDAGSGPLPPLTRVQVECVVLIGALSECFEDGSGGGLDRPGLRCHAAAVATLAHALAERLGADATKAFTAGLLHDVGRVVLDRHCQRGFAAVLRYRNRHDTWIRDAEQAVLGYDHAAVGDALADHWGLPAWLRDVLRWHHAPQSRAMQPSVTGLVHVADVLARGLSVGDPGDDTVPFLSPAVLERLGATWGDLRLVLPAVENERAAALALLEGHRPVDERSGPA